MNIASEVLSWRSLHKPYIVTVGLYAMKMMYTLDCSDGSIIQVIFNFPEAIEKFAHIHKHHHTFYATSFQQYKRSSEAK